jgi:hypothetical protein
MSGKGAPSIATEAALRGLVRRLMLERFTETQSIWVEGHLNLLCDLRRILGNDLDKAIILAVVGQRMLRAAITETHSHEQVLAGVEDVIDERLTNIESVTAATGLPRESVRRKVHEMIEAGWMRRTSHGGLAIEPTGAIELQSSTGIAMDLLDLVFARFAGLMVREGWLAIEVAASGEPSEAPHESRKAAG